MRVLLDECVNSRLGRHISGHDVWTVRRAGWSGIKNGALLAKAAAEFDVFVTVDQNLQFQQKIAGLAMAVIVLKPRSIALAALLPLAPSLSAAIGVAQDGTVTVIE